MHVILLTKAIWAAAKDADITKKARNTSLIVRKSRGDIEICCSGGVDILGPTDSEGAGGTRDAEEAGDVGSRAGTVGAMDAGI